MKNLVTINIMKNTTTGGNIDCQRTNDFPNCALNDKAFIISNPNKHKVGRIQIK